MIPKPPPRPPYDSQRTLAWAVIAFLALNLVVETVELFYFGNLLGQLGPGLLHTSRELYEALLIVLEITVLGVVLLTGIAFSVWLMGCYRNLDALGGGPRRFSDAWAVVGFLVPVVNFYRPFQIVQETWQKSIPLRPEGSAARSTLVPWWFALFLGAGLLTLLAGTARPMTAAWATLNIARVLITMVDAVLAILLVQEITRNQEEKVVEAARPAGVPPGRWRHLETIGAAGGAGGAGELELSVVAGADTGKVFPLIGAEIVIGRQDRNAAPPWGSVAVQEASVSRVHAVLNWNNEHNVYTIQHRSRTNLTVLNGKPLGESVVPISPGDHIRMGRLEMVVRVRASSAPYRSPEAISRAVALETSPPGEERETQVFPTPKPAPGAGLAAWLPNPSPSPSPPAAAPEALAAAAPPPLRSRPFQTVDGDAASASVADEGRSRRFAEVAAEAAEATPAAATSFLDTSLPTPDEAPPETAPLAETVADPLTVAPPWEKPAPLARRAPLTEPPPSREDERQPAVDPLMALLGRTETAAAPTESRADAPADRVPEDLTSTVVDETADAIPAVPADEPAGTRPKARPSPRRGRDNATPHSLFSLGDTTPAVTPPRIRPYPVPSPTVPRAAPTPGLLPQRERPIRPSPAGATGAPRLTPQIEVPKKPSPPEPAAPAAEAVPDPAKRTFYVPASQLTSMARAPVTVETHMVLEIAAGNDTGVRIPLDRSAVMLGRRTAAGEPDPYHQVALDDPYLPREHAVLLWDAPQQSFRLHLLENAMVTTRVLRKEALGERDYLVTYRQPFMLQGGDEIVAGDSRMRLLKD